MRYSVTSLTPKNPEDIFTAFIEVNDENKLEAYHNNLCGFNINRYTFFHFYSAGRAETGGKILKRYYIDVAGR